MTQEQKQVKDWMVKFGQDCPDKPTIPSLEIRQLRAKLILEEALETIKALGFGIAFDQDKKEWIPVQVLEYEPDLIEIADGCSDLKVVTEGTLIACGLVKPIACDQPDWKLFIESHNDPLFNEVMRSNESKMWKYEEIDELPPHHKYNVKPVYKDNDCIGFIVKDKSGKVIKSPSYSPANLQPIIEEMSK